MDRTKLYTKYFTTEEQNVLQLDYFLVNRSAEQGQVYGVAVQKRNAATVEEAAEEFLTEDKGQAEKFLFKLAEGLVTPMELSALCDDYISEKESKNSYNMVQAAS